MTEKRAHLLRIQPAQPGGSLAVHPFEGARMTIGRSEECSIVVQVNGISSVHARLERRILDLQAEVTYAKRKQFLVRKIFPIGRRQDTGPGFQCSGHGRYSNNVPAPYPTPHDRSISRRHA